MSWKDPFERQWPDPVDDLRQRFGIDLPSFMPHEIAMFTGVLLVTLALVVLVLEWLL